MLIDLVLEREIEPGKVFDLTLPLADVADRGSPRFAAHAEALAPRLRWCVCRDPHHQRESIIHIRDCDAIGRHQREQQDVASRQAHSRRLN
jgi:hypothetical protein